LTLNDLQLVKKNLKKKNTRYLSKSLAMLAENVTLCVSGEVANEPVEYLSRRFSVGSAKKDGWCKSISCGHFPVDKNLKPATLIPQQKNKRP
jgi:hypothetical protein